MSGNSNFQDVVQLNQATLTLGVEELVMGTSNDAFRVLIFAQDTAQASAIYLSMSNPSGQNSVFLPAGNGTAMLVTQIVFPVTTMQGPQISFQSIAGGFNWTGNGSTLSLSLSQLSALTLNNYANTVPLTSSGTFSMGINASSNATFSTAAFSAIRLAVTAPLQLSYIDPGGQQSIGVSGVVENGTFTLAASATWFAGLYTMNGSTASLVSSTSNSTLASVATSTGGTTTTTATVVADPRFTNLTWNVTMGDYLLVLGTTLSGSMTYNGAFIVAQNQTISLIETAFGATRAQVSYSVPYFGDGTVSASANSYNLTDIAQSGGTNVTSVSPRIVMLGT